MCNEIEKKDLFNVIESGSSWTCNKIKATIEGIQTESVFDYGRDVRWDEDGECHYIWVNECYLFIFNGGIVLRCDRENVFSSGVKVTFPVESVSDVQAAYNKYHSMTIEDLEEN